MQESLILDFIAKFNLILIEMLNNIGEIWVDLSSASLCTPVTSQTAQTQWWTDDLYI